ncbi:MAG: hypothetical protein PHC75_06500 [Burkholderiales bacterium]|nr:hypothetical protein [Burkholderiales bacterium]
MAEQYKKGKKPHNRNHNNYEERNSNYGQEYNEQKKFFTNKKILIGLIGLLVIVGGLIYKANSHDDLLATVVSVEPNYKAIQIESKDCHNITSHEQVKNPNRTFWNGMFDSSKHPKYLTKETSHVVCHETSKESEVLQYYTVQYKIKNAVNTIIVRDNPPAVNIEIPLSQLQSYMESSSVTVGVLDTESK